MLPGWFLFFCRFISWPRRAPAMQGTLVVARWPRPVPLDITRSSTPGPNNGLLATADSGEREADQHLACTCDVSDANNALLHDRHLRVLACKERDLIALRSLNVESSAPIGDAAPGAEGLKEEHGEGGTGAARISCQLGVCRRPRLVCLLCRSQWKRSSRGEP